MVKSQRDMAARMLSTASVWGLIGAVFLPIYKEDSPLWISVVMAVAAIVAIAVAFKLMGKEYPEKPSTESASSGDGMNPVILTGAAMALADDDVTDSVSSAKSSDSTSSSSSSRDEGGSSSSGSSASSD